MRRLPTLLMLSLLAMPAWADRDGPPSHRQLRKLNEGHDIPRVVRTEITMHWHGRPFRIFISAPRGKAPPEGFPVLYVTDANGTFDTAAQAAYVQSFYPEVTHVDRAIVVGIGYDTDLPFPPERAYDLSPPDPNPPANVATMRNEAIAGTGGADYLLVFIDRVLKPMIGRLYPVDADRLGLFGHSRGGLFVLHALFTRPASFRYYVAASPAIWWHDRFVLKEGQKFADDYMRHPMPLHLLLTTGGREQQPAFATGTGLTADGRAARATHTAMVANAEQLAEDLSALTPQGFDVRYESIADTDHITVLPAAISAGVTFCLTRQDGPDQQDHSHRRH